MSIFPHPHPSRWAYLAGERIEGEYPAYLDVTHWSEATDVFTRLSEDYLPQSGLFGYNRVDDFDIDWLFASPNSPRSRPLPPSPTISASHHSYSPPLTRGRTQARTQARAAQVATFSTSPVPGTSVLPPLLPFGSNEPLSAPPRFTTAPPPNLSAPRPSSAPQASAPPPSIDVVLLQLLASQQSLVQAVRDLTTLVQPNVPVPGTSLFSHPPAPPTHGANPGPTYSGPAASTLVGNAVQKPSSFRGTRGPDARRFLAQFQAYARGTGLQLNSWNTSMQKFVIAGDRWIPAALSFMQDEAALWATPFMEEISRDGQPFKNWDWAEFMAQFKLRFESADEKQDAIVALEALTQGSLTVAEYTARFHEVAGRTDFSQTDLRQRYYVGLGHRIKDTLAMVDRPHHTLPLLISVAQELDNRLRVRDAERLRDRGTTSRFGPPKPFAGRSTYGPPMTSGTQDVSATVQRPPKPASTSGKSYEDFMTWMNGRCFGCGSKDHRKREGGHDREICTFCQRVGHREDVCQSRFMGQARTTQKCIAATSGSAPQPVVEDLPSAKQAEETPIMSAAAVAELEARYKALEERLEAYSASF